MLGAARDDPSVLRAILADDVVWELSSIQMVGEKRFNGPDGVLEFFRQWTEPFTDWDFTFDEVSEVGDCVVAHIHQWGTGRGSGARVENDFWQVWKMRDGKAVRGTNHQTREQALAATET